VAVESRASTSRFDGIQALRFLAAALVVVTHATLYTHERLDESVPVWHFGEIGVRIFFAISGFVMIVSTRSMVGTADGWKRFSMRRLIRIVPVYWLATGVMAAGALAGLFPNLVLTAGHVAASLFFVPMRSPSSGELWPLLVQGWTLNYEMFFYAVFAACLLLPARLRLGTVAGLFGLLAAAGLAVNSDNAVFVTYTRPIILEFVAGMAIGRLWLAGRVPGRAMAIGLIGASLAGFAAIGIFRLPFDEWTCGPLAAALVCGTAALERRASMAQLKLPALLGAASYSIYLWHTFAISVVARAGAAAGLPPLLVLILSTFAGIAAGLCAYGLIERPLLRAGRPPATAGAARSTA